MIVANSKERVQALTKHSAIIFTLGVVFCFIRYAQCCGDAGNETRIAKQNAKRTKEISAMV